HEIMAAMQILERPLSYTLDANGEVHFYQDETSGEHVLNTKDKILCFNSVQAANCRFSKGTADTLEELTRAMGLSEVEWVGAKKPGYLWPVCKAEEHMI